MEDDARSDSGVSTLRSDGARSSGDERSGSRSSAISDDRSGSRPSASHSAEPDIKIVGTVAGRSGSSGPHHHHHQQHHSALLLDKREAGKAAAAAPWSRHDHEAVALLRRDQEALVRRDQETALIRRDQEAAIRREQEAVLRREQEAAIRREQEASLARHFQSARSSMADPRNPLGLPPGSLSGLSAAHAASLQAQLAAAAAHYGGPGSLPPGLLPPQALLQYQLAAASSLGIPADALLKQQYGGLAASHLLGPGSDLLMERERQIAQDRDRQLREKKEQEQRERDRLDKERMERERRDREERERRDRERRDREERERRERQAREEVNRHFQMSMELAQKLPPELLFNQRASGNWSSSLAGLEKGPEIDSRAHHHHQQQQQHYLGGDPSRRGLPPPAHGGQKSLGDPLKERSALTPAHIPGAPPGFRPVESYGGARIPPPPSSGHPPSSSSAYQQQQQRGGPSPHHHGGPSPHPHGGPSPHHHAGPSPHHRGPSPHHRGPSPHHRGPSPHHRGPSPHHPHPHLHPQSGGPSSPHHSPPERYAAVGGGGGAYSRSSFVPPGSKPPLTNGYGAPASAHSPLPAPPPRLTGSPLPYGAKLLAGPPQPALHSPSGQSQRMGSSSSGGPPLAHGGMPGHAAWHAKPPAVSPGLLSPRQQQQINAGHPYGVTMNGGDLYPLDLGAAKRKCEGERESPESPLGLHKAARLEAAAAASPGQLHRVTEPATLGAQVIGAEATPITSIVNTAALSAASSRPPEPSDHHQRSSPSLLPLPLATTTATTATASSTASAEEQAEDTCKSSAAAEKNPAEFTGYVHKLKKAWMVKNTAAPAEPATLPPAINGGNNDASSSSSNGRSNIGNSGSGASSTATSPQLTRATPSPAGSTKSTGSGKGFPNAVRSAPAAADMAPLRLNGHHNHQGSPASDRKEEEDDEEDLSSAEEEEEAKPTPKHRKKPAVGAGSAKGKPGPKPKGRPAATPKAKSSAAARRVASKGSDSEFSDSEKESDSSKASSRQSEAGGNTGKKRGRKPLKAGGAKSGKSDELSSSEPRPKKLKAEPPVGGSLSGNNSAKNSGDPFARPSISQLKKTGDSFLQDASCFEVAPKLNKCRECRWSQAQRQKQSHLANIFCRFYAFRRLRYTKNGQIAQAGFCDPRQDAQAEDLKLWLPSQELSPPDMDKETAKLILRHLSSQFYTIYRQEQEALSIHLSEDLTVAWKRVVQGVREMCDVCEATLFNKHWACGKCGFVVCIDCYRTRTSGEEAAGQDADTDTAARDRDRFSWLFCTNRQSHQPDSMMLTQIIAGDALEEVNNRLRLLARLHRTDNQQQQNGWQDPDSKAAAASTNGSSSSRPANGIKPEADIKEEEDRDTSNLRDLLPVWSDYSWGHLDTEPISLTEAESRQRFPAHSAHAWLCGGHVLRLDDPRDPANLDLFKFAWLRSQPVLINGLLERMDRKLWTPDNFVSLPEPTASPPPSGHHGSPPGSPVDDHVPAAVAASAVSDGQSLRTFFQGFENLSVRPVDEKTGEPLSLRLRENWPSQEDQFQELLPAQYRDLMAHLPLPEYLDRDGVLNLAARLPDCFVRVDLGPRLWGGYARTTYPLQYSVSDALHVSVATGKDYYAVSGDGEGSSSSSGDVLADLVAAGCPDMERPRQQPGRVAAVWQVFHPNHADRLKAFILRHTKTGTSEKLASAAAARNKDPLQEPSLFLTERLLVRLKEEEGLVPWTLVQMRGEGILIPAGAPYQVRLVHATLLVQSDFVSPEHMVQSVRLSFSDVQQFDDRLQVKNIIFHACKDALSVLQKPEGTSSSNTTKNK